MAEKDVGTEARDRPRYFIPVFLYPHVKYRTRHGILDLIAKYRLADHDHLVVVADEVQTGETSPAVGRMRDGPQWQTERARTLLDRSEVLRLFGSEVHDRDERQRGALVSWGQITKTAPFAALEARLSENVTANPRLMQTMGRAVERRLALLSQPNGFESAYQAEFDAALGEIAMSLYCTEVLSYRTEIWERPLDADSIDPLGTVYRDHPDIVRAACQRSRTMRRLEFLYASRFDDFV